MKLSVRHQISIEVGGGVARAVQHLLLTPQNSPGQTIREWKLDMPGIADAAGFTDACGNRCHLVTQSRPEAELILTATGVVETFDRNGVLGRLPREPVPALFTRVTALTSPDPRIVEGLAADWRDRIALLHELMARVGEVLAPESQTQSQNGKTQAQSPATEAGAEAFAHAFIGGARALKVPARYVTGYLAASDDGPAAFHAWAEAFDEGLGWIGFDAMLQICPVEGHIRVAIGLDAASAAPVRAVPGAGAADPLVLQVEAAQ